MNHISLYLYQIVAHLVQFIIVFEWKNGFERR